jgi:tetratricopeptide (TPR) repeat protein
MKSQIQSSIIVDNASVDTHHDILSMPARQEIALSSFLQQAQVNPLDRLFQLEAQAEATDPLLQEPSILLAPREEAPTVVNLGPEAPLSKTLLWKMQEDYYKNAGIAAWECDVPFFVTSSVYIADAYAEMILGFVRDYREHLDFSEPIYIVEMATGTGRFSHMLLQELLRKQSYFESLRDLQFRYVMTDFTDSNPTFWQNHDKLRPFIEKGVLDFAVFNPLQDQVLNLRVSGKTVDSGAVRNPMIAIANYFFDTISQDFFRVESKRLMEGLVTLERNLVGPDEQRIDPDSPPHISQVTQRVRYRELPNDHYYPDARLNAVLNHYRHNIRNGSIIFPLGAFNVIRNLEKLSNNQLVLISSDKAFTSRDQMACFYEHNFAAHNGAFSYMVNYDALAQYFKNEGGCCFQTNGHSLGLQTVCLVQVDQEDCRFEHLEYLYREKVDRSQATTSLVSLLPEFRELSDVQLLDQMIAQIRLHLADPKIFCSLGQAMIDLVPKGTAAQHHDLVGLMEKAMDNYYYFPGEVNLPFWMSQIYFCLGMHQQALAALDKTLQHFGSHEALYYLKGQNYERLGQMNEARDMYEQALELNPALTQATEALLGVRMKIK